MLVPYSTYQVVACPFGLTVPVTVAVVGPTAVTEPVIAVGTAAVARRAGARRGERDGGDREPDHRPDADALLNNAAA